MIGKSPPLLVDSLFILLSFLRIKSSYASFLPNLCSTEKCFSIVFESMGIMQRKRFLSAEDHHIFRSNTAVITRVAH